MGAGANSRPGPLTEQISLIIYNAFLELLTTQKKLGTKLGIPQSRMSEYLRGVKALDIETFDILCEAVDRDPVRVLEVARERVRLQASETETPSPQ